MKKILITQRYEKIGEFKELRDNLDVRLASLILKLGYIPVTVPTNLIKFLEYIKQISPSGIILSGGGDPRKIDDRYILEKKLLNFASKNKIPLLGICRGAQRINIHFKGKLKKIKNHVRKNHFILGPSLAKGIKVNSFHDYGFDNVMMGKNLKMLASSKDDVVEYFKHVNKSIYGIMWHPERNKKIKKFDREILKKIFK